MHLSFSGCCEFLDCLQAERSDDPLWVLLFADCHADSVPGLLVAARERGMRLCGGVFPGLIDGSRRVDEGCIAIPQPEGTQLAVGSLSGARLEWSSPLPEMAGTHSCSAMVFVDCLAAGITGFLEVLFDTYGNHIHYAGAGTGFHDLRNAPSVFSESGFVESGVLFLLVPRQLTVSVQHGWRRIAGPFIATRTRGNVILEFDWSAAGPFYRSQVEAQDATMRGRPLFPDINAVYPLCIGKEGCEDVMRDPMRIGDAGEIAVLSDVTENSAMYLAHGDAASLVAAARQAVMDCGRPGLVDVAFVSDCYSRALALGEAFGDELAEVSDALREITAARPEGVLALGEVAANRRANLEFYNKTFVVALRHE